MMEKRMETITQIIYRLGFRVQGSGFRVEGWRVWET